MTAIEQKFLSYFNNYHMRISVNKNRMFMIIHTSDDYYNNSKNIVEELNHVIAIYGANTKEWSLGPKVWGLAHYDERTILGLLNQYFGYENR